MSDILIHRRHIHKGMDSQNEAFYREVHSILAERYGAVGLYAEDFAKGHVRFWTSFDDEAKHQEFSNCKFLKPGKAVHIELPCLAPDLLGAMVGAAAETWDENEIFQEEIVLLPGMSSYSSGLQLAAKTRCVGDCFVEEAKATLIRVYALPDYAEFCLNRLTKRGEAMIRKALETHRPA